MRRVLPDVLRCFGVLSVLALVTGASGAAAADDGSAATGSSLELAKTADAEVVDAGDRIGFRIDLTNRGETPAQGLVIIEVRVDPNSAIGAFLFSGDLGTFGLGSTTRIKTFKAVPPGTYAVTQAPPGGGFSLTGLDCDDDDSGTDLTARSATIQLQAGETVRCIYTNHVDHGLVIVETRVDPNWVPAAFSFSSDLGSFGLGSTTRIKTFKAVPPGTYAVTQAPPGGGFSLTGLDCDDDDSGTDLTARTATIQLQAGETVRCIYTNAISALPNGRGVVVIENQAPAVHDGAGASFTHDLAACGAFSLPGSGTAHACPNVVPGTYTVTQTTLSGNGQFVSLDCDDDNSTVDQPTRTATIRVEADETVRCTWINEDRRGVVVIENQAPADDEGPGASFTHDLAACGAFSLSASGTAHTCPNVVPGTYTVTETTLSGNGQFVSLDCDDDNSTVDQPTRTATIRVEADETVRCTWINRIPSDEGSATNVVLTDELPAGPGLSWSLEPALAGCAIQAGLLSCSFGSLGESETVSVHVSSPTTTASCGRWANAALARADNRSEARASASVTVVCPARIVVAKQTEPDGSQQPFAFLGAITATLADGQSEGRTVAPGTYTVSELVPAGWDATAIHCEDPSSDSTGSTVPVGPGGTATASFRVAAGETVTCTFTNTQRGSVTLRKTMNGVVDPSKDVCFVLSGPGLPSSGASECTFGDLDGVLEWPDLVPGEYGLCESPVPAGFTSFWTQGGVVVTPYNPDATRTPPEDLGDRCHDFEVSAGEAVRFEVDNSHPGGDPRTIGYWKNWNLCTIGNQSQTAAKSGGAAAGFFLVEDLLPQLVGDFGPTTCQQAVKLLSKQDQGARNKASDAAYELGAQLLATRLNLAAGAETCLALQQAVLDGQTLLDGIGFSGSGDYLGSKSKDTRRPRALALAGALDRYNNGSLC